MHKNHLHTTLSNKHFELLKKYTEKFGTRQKVLETALESLENSAKQGHILSQEDKLWLAAKDMRSTCLIQKDVLKSLMQTADFKKIAEVMTNQKPTEYLIINHFQKPLTKCNLKEVIDGLIIVVKAQNVADTINYTDDGSHYTLRLIHSLNFNTSKIFKMFIENMFETYGVKTESEISDNIVFMKIYKNL